MKTLTTTLVLALLAFACFGCSGGDDMNKNEEQALKNPNKTVPAAAQAGMANIADMTKKQQEANKAAGVDDQGIPIKK